MNLKNWKRWEKIAVLAFIVVVSGAIMADFRSPNSSGKFIGMAALGALYIFIRARALFGSGQKKCRG